MADDYTPSTDVLRASYTDANWNGVGERDHDAEFDRWMASVEAAAEQRGAEKERERIAQAIEAERPAWIHESISPSDASGQAVWIAREGE